MGDIIMEGLCVDPCYILIMLQSENFNLILLFFLSFVFQPRYHIVKHLDLEFAQDIEDNHLKILKSKVYFYL